jgi:hypothetical protein
MVKGVQTICHRETNNPINYFEVIVGMSIYGCAIDELKQQSRNIQLWVNIFEPR